jgi:hypothetical protein
MQIFIEIVKNPLTRKIVLSSVLVVGSGVSIYLLRKGISEYVIPLLLKNLEKKLPNLSKEDIEVLLDILDVLSITLFVAATSVVALQYVKQSDLIPYLLVELARVGSITNEDAQEAYKKILEFLFKEKKNFFSMESFKDPQTYQKFLDKKFEGLLKLIAVGNGENSRFRDLNRIENITNVDVEKLSRLVNGLYKRLMHSPDFLSIPFALEFLKVGHPLDENHLKKLAEIIRLLQERFANRVKYLAFLFKTETINIRDIYLALLEMDSDELKEFLKLAKKRLSYLQYRTLLFLIKLYYILLSIYREGFSSLLKFIQDNYALTQKPSKYVEPVFAVIKPSRKIYIKYIKDKFWVICIGGALLKNYKPILLIFPLFKEMIPFSRLLK